MPAKLSVKHGWLVRYAAALAAVGAGLLLRVGLTALVGPGLPTYVTFYPPVMVAALLCGFGPGLLATVMVALVADYWLLDRSVSSGSRVPLGPLASLSSQVWASS